MTDISADGPQPGPADDKAERERSWKRGPRFDLPGPGRWIAGIFGAIVLLIIIFLLLFQWDWLRKPLADFVSKKIHRTVAIDGHLRVHLLTWMPTVTVEGVRIGQPAWAPKGDMLQVKSFTTSVRLMPLFAGKIDIPLVAIEQPNAALLQNAQGLANWDFSTPEEKKKPSKPLKLPPIEEFRIDDGKLLADIIPRKLKFSGTISSNERDTGSNAESFHLGGTGMLNGKPFNLRVAGGPLIHIRRDRPYPFEGVVSAGATSMTAKGQIPHPFDFGHVEAALTVQGHDLNDLYYLTGLALPNTPPYRISGRLTRDLKVYRFDGFSGRVGSSDLEGNLSVDTAPKRPFLKAALHSKLLDFKDLASLFGAPGAAKTATAAQKVQTAKATAGDTRLLPDATLQTERMRVMDAAVTYKAADVKAPGLPLRGVDLGVKLDDGFLDLDPITFDFPQGSLRGNAQLNARPASPITNVDLRLSNVRMEEFVPSANGAPKMLDGTLQARAKLKGVGNSVHAAASTADGQVTAVIPSGHIRKAFAELAGVSLLPGLPELLGKNQDQADLRCAVADFDVKNGVLQARNILVDATVTVVRGTGSIDLKDETYHLSFQGRPTHFRFGHLAVPVTMGGHLKSPSFGVQPGKAAVQAGVGVALGALINPLLAIAPFVDLGSKNASCQNLFQEARDNAAPVAAKSAPPAPARKATRRHARRHAHTG
ncbi:MAG: AsmA family protein [Caulobacteraceae bacterium]|nr:AsmA family protein [Caulobacter sp.]